MLAHPRHPPPVPLASSSAAASASQTVTSSRPPLHLSRSSSHRAPASRHTTLASSHSAQHPTAPPAAHDPSRAMPAPPRPASSTTALVPSDKENARPPSQQQQQHHHPQDNQKDKATAEKPPKDRAKLTQQWGEPPTRIRRDSSWLDRGDLLGEGGFARVYLCTEPDGVSYKALKVIDKRQLKSTKTKSKLFAEIKIHQAMQHPNVIAFEHCFEDEGNVYMQLELCSNGSLLDLLRIRKRYSEPEARFYLTQLVGACDYMHANSVIHRDLKLGNLMLDANMDLRVGDFGLAALVKFPGERKKTICGTPNYIAPEILFDTKGGHSFEVDIWSIGVILYTLLIGRPPFQTKDVKNIYRKIRDNAYTFPTDHALSPESLDLISWILRPTPSERPSLAQILAHPWFVTGPFPPRVSTRATDPARVDGVLDEWSRMSRRQAGDNFRRCKRRAGIVELEGAAAGGQEVVSQALPVVVEAAEPEPGLEASERGGEEEREQPAAAAVAGVAAGAGASASAGRDEAKDEARRPTRMLRPSEERDAKGRVEKEVRQATAPESPISELLRSARKPLMVSPSSRAAPLSRPPVPSRLSASSSAAQPSSASSSSSSSSAAAPPPQQPAFQRTRTTSAPSASAAAAGPPPAAQGPRHRRAGAQAHVDVVAPAPTAAPALAPGRAHASAPPPARTAAAPAPATTSHPSRSLYDTTWRALDAFLACSCAADVAAAEAAVEAWPADDGEDERPRVFITSWVDYTHKYGTAYSLTDGTAGLYFNDSTTMVLSPDKEHFDYISNRQSNIYTRRHHALSSVPEALERKAYLLRYFEDYMAKTLRRDVSWTFDDVERRKNMEFLVKYYRMKSAIVFKMSNDVLQFNFYDHHKLILSHQGRLLTFISPSFTLSTYSLAALFRLAAAAGHYSPRRAPAEGTERRERLDELRTLLGKVEYVRDVLRTLAQRKSASASASAGKDKDAAREKERAERATT
ncbi:kinase-like domain-containing protein [Rhodotorula diobovata]|uniref:Kinase-like domain-containing protein n=1 Tax=Rhodotorula diobovata TaxID=5288 RepID=A0A5C5FTH5_9BASI|nr:kinase-like domain-containing protein [Rhodotorula diobovata]